MLDWKDNSIFRKYLYAYTQFLIIGTFVLFLFKYFILSVSEIAALMSKFQTIYRFSSHIYSFYTYTIIYTYVAIYLHEYVYVCINCRKVVCTIIYLCEWYSFSSLVYLYFRFILWNLFATNL